VWKAVEAIPRGSRLQAPTRFDVYACTSNGNAGGTDASIGGLEWHGRPFGISEETALRYLPKVARSLLELPPSVD